MIKSFLDLDLYKATMLYAVLSNKNLSNLRVRYRFTNRNNTLFPDGFDKELKRQIEHLSSIYLTNDEKKFFKYRCGCFLPDWFFDFLSGYRYDPKEVKITLIDGVLDIEIEGLWYRTILWEVILMAIISELYFEMANPYDFNNVENRQKRLENNLHKASEIISHKLKVSEFGTRRRFSYENQKEVIGDLLSYNRNTLVGTSNIHFAKIFDIPVHGTVAHEYFMIHSGLFGYNMANTTAMNNWVESYRGNLGTILTDTFTTDVFLRSFDMQQSKLWDSVRHDSGSPYEFTDKIVDHYNKMKIDTRSKSIIFSDGLNINSCIDINKHCNEKNINCSFGVGTFMTNNIKDVKPLNIVIKVSEVYFNDRWIPLVKLSDNKSKHTGQKDEIEFAKRTLGIGEIIYDKKPAGNEND